MSSDRRYEGVVCWFGGRNDKVGKPCNFGFISRPDERDLFVHFSDIDSPGYKTLKKGQKVTFGLGKNHEGTDKAIEVRVVEENKK